MKKLKLNLTNFNEVLSRQQMETVVGGYNPNCEGVGDQQVCCASGGASGDQGTCQELSAKDCTLIVSISDSRCPS